MKTFLCAASAFVIAITSAQAKPVCAPSNQITEELSAMFDEEPVAFGLQGNGALLQIYASEKGTWTAVSTTPAGMSCIVSVGKHWEMLPAVKVDPLA